MMRVSPLQLWVFYDSKRRSFAGYLFLPYPCSFSWKDLGLFFPFRTGTIRIFYDTSLIPATIPISVAIQVGLEGVQCSGFCEDDLVLHVNLIKQSAGDLSLLLFLWFSHTSGGCFSSSLSLQPPVA